MSIKSILAHVDPQQFKPVLAATAFLANKFEAHVNGLTVERQVFIPSYVAAEMPNEIVQSFKHEQLARLKEAQTDFTDAMSGAGRIARTSWESTADDAAAAIAKRSRVNDLVIVAQDHPKNSANQGENLPGEVINTAEGGVLVVPYIGFEGHIGKSALIAWNDTNESARAVQAALPILKQADTVEVIIVTKEGRNDASGSDISRYLAEHGIEVTLSYAAATNIDVANVILNNVSDKGHDLIVMGGYSHMRLREAILGGVTRDILRHMTVPVLFAH